MPTTIRPRNNEIVESEPLIYRQGINHLYFYADITQHTVGTFAFLLRDATKELLLRAHEEEKDPLEIHLHVHSFGGSLFAGIAAMESILQCPVPVYTYIEGFAASAATFMTLAGKKRFIGKHSFVLIHQLSYESWGTFEQQKESFENSKAHMALIRQIYTERTNIPKTVLSSLLKRDCNLNAEQALRYGVVDKVI